MGIPRFMRWILDKYRANKRMVVRHTPPENVDHLLLDANGIIYNVVARIVPAYVKGTTPVAYLPSVKDIYQAVWDEIKRICIFVHPRKSYGIFFDGPPPVGKMYEQRRRRYAAATHLAEYFDKNQITPGTPFMLGLDDFLQKHIPKENDFPGTIYYSNTLVPGEGEHKLFELLRDGTIPSTDTTLIYGADSDLVMLSILPISTTEDVYANLWLYREQSLKLGELQFKTELLISNEDREAGITAKNIGYRVDCFQVSDIRQIIHRCLGTQANPSPLHILSFVLFATLIGDDFIPILPELADPSIALDVLCDVYQSTGCTPLYTEKGGTNFDALMTYFSKLMAIIEHPEKSPLFALRDRYAGLYSTIDHGGYVTFRNVWYTNALAPRAYNSGPRQMGDRLKPKYILHMSRMYVAMMVWVGRYYRGGMLAVNIDLFYPYNYAPTCVDIWGYLKMLINPTLRPELKLPAIGPQSIQSYNAFDQLLSVLPRQSSYILKELGAVPAHILSRNSMFNYMFPSTILIQPDVTGTSALKEGGFIRHHVLIPPPNMQVLRELMRLWKVNTPLNLRIENSLKWVGKSSQEYLNLPRAWSINQVMPRNRPTFGPRNTGVEEYRERDLQKERDIRAQLAGLIDNRGRVSTYLHPIHWTTDTLIFGGVF